MIDNMNKYYNYKKGIFKKKNSEKLSIETRLDLKKTELLNYIESVDDFWKLSEYISWYDYIKNYNNSNFNHEINIAYKRFDNYIKMEIRKNKIKNINNKNVKIKSEYELIKYYKSTYDNLSNLIISYFILKNLKKNTDNIKEEFIFLDSKTSIICFGKEFTKNIINKKISIKFSNEIPTDVFRYIFARYLFKY